MKEMCKKCVKKKECVKLCKEAEEYVNQDFVPIEEGLVGVNLENMEIQIKISYEYLQDNWYEIFFKRYSALLEKKAYEAGYKYGDGQVVEKECIETKERIYTYYLGKRDILFKQFKRWKPEWEKRKEILFRSWS